MLTSQDMKAIADFLDAPIIILLLFVMIYTTFIGLSAIVRRVHDYDGSVFLCLASILVPIVGVFLFFYLLIFSKGIEGPTIYGPDPKGGPNAYNDWVKFMNRRNKISRSNGIYYSSSSHKLSSDEEERMREEEERKHEEEYRRQCEWQREQDEYYYRRQKEEEERAEEERCRQEFTRRMQEEDEMRRRQSENHW